MSHSGAEQFRYFIGKLLLDTAQVERMTKLTVPVWHLVRQHHGGQVKLGGTESCT
jgi:hypothetical protein